MTTTTTAAFTKVGWTVRNHAELKTCDRYKGAYEIAEACEGEHEANQQLLGAAPALLAACEAAYKKELTDSEMGEPIPHDDACYCTDTGTGEVVGGVMVGDVLQCLPCQLRLAIARAAAPDARGAAGERDA